MSKVINGENIAVVEPYFEWIIEQSQFAPDTSYQLSHVVLVDNLLPFIERKLFIVNAEHAAFAYVGALFSYGTIQEAILDARVNHLVREFLSENLEYFTTQYSMNRKEVIELQNMIAELGIKSAVNIISNLPPLLADDISAIYQTIKIDKMAIFSKGDDK